MKIIGYYDCFTEHTDSENAKMQKLLGNLTVNDLRIYLKRLNLELDNRHMKELDDDLFAGNIPFFVQDKSSAYILCRELNDRVYQKVDPLTQKNLNEVLEDCYSASKRSIKRLSKCSWAKKYEDCELPSFSLIEKMIMRRDLKVIENLQEEFRSRYTYRVAVSADELMILGSDYHTIILLDKTDWSKYVQQICQKRQTEKVNCEV